MQRYDKAEYEERLETAQLIGDISQNQIDIQWTPKVREAEANRQQAEAVLNNQNATAAEKAEARQIKSQSEQIIATYGKGGDYQLAVRAVTGVLQGLATGNQNAAWVNGLSPYANNLIKTYTTDESGQVNTTANLMAHAMLGALEAYATGNHAAAGAAGAITSEVAAKLITEQLYHTEPDKLTDDQKQVVATLSQVTAGLAGIVTSDSTQNAVSAAEIGKRAVENNNLGNIIQNPEYALSLALQAEGERIKNEIESKAKEEVIDKLDEYIPHYVSINGQVYGIGLKTTVNLRNGDVVGGGTFSPVTLPNRFGQSVSASFGWIINLDSADIKTDEGERIMGHTISKVIEGSSVGVSGCYKFGCLGYGRTISINPTDKTYHTIELGIGTGSSGGAINQERTYKIGNIRGTDSEE